MSIAVACGAGRHRAVFCPKRVKRDGLKLRGVSQFQSLASISAIGGPGSCVARRKSGLPDRAGRFWLIKLHNDSTRFHT